MSTKNLTKKQAEKIIAIIEKDAKVQSCYYHPIEGTTCVLGGLALKANISVGELIELREEAIVEPLCFKVRRAIKSNYGLTARQQNDLQFINDFYNSITKRRKELIAEVKNWIK